MPTSTALDCLFPIAKHPVQVYFSNRIQIADVMEWAIAQIGPSDLVITTFSTSEEFIRRVSRLKTKGLVKSCDLFCDIRAARKTLAIYNFIKATFDNVYLCENHSKVLLLHGEKTDVAIITSQNQTRGDRYECGVISVMSDMYSSLSDSINQLKTVSRPLHELIATTT